MANANNTQPLPRNAPEWLPRFMAKVEIDAETGCWIWTACRNHQGYGQFQLDGRKQSAHRLAYTAFVGAIPEGLVMDHSKCENKSCVNPRHVRPVTVRENVLRSESLQSRNLAKTHCAHGHAFTPENTRRSAEGRVCRTCQKAMHDAWKRKRFAAGWTRDGRKWVPPR